MNRGLPKLRATFLGEPIKRLIVFGVYIGVPLFWRSIIHLYTHICIYLVIFIKIHMYKSLASEGRRLFVLRTRGHCLGSKSAKRLWKNVSTGSSKSNSSTHSKSNSSITSNSNSSSNTNSNNNFTSNSRTNSNRNFIGI